MRFFIISMLIVNVLIDVCDGARILGVFHIPAFSHQQLGVKLFEELADRGHDITLITPMDPKTPIKNLKVVKLNLELQEDTRFNLFDYTFDLSLYHIFFFEASILPFVEEVLNQTSVQTLLQSNEQFDVVIIEQFLNEAFRGFCHHFQAHCVMLSTIGTNLWTNPQMANPASPSYVPDLFLSYSSHMNFWQRLHNTFVYIGRRLFNHFYMFPKHNEVMQKYFPGAPDLSELYYNTSLMLVNSHLSINPPTPRVPNVIDIGGFHLEPPKKLPSDLQEFLDESKEGVIYFSMGSHLRTSDIPVDTRNVILRVFSKLRQKVLWKWDEDSLPGQPPNVKISKWLPQQDVLAHPNIKLFITHGGLLSTFEAIYHGVPMVGIPIMGDQKMNIANAAMDGYAVGLPFLDINEQTLSDTLREVLENPKYTETAKRRSEIFHDEPMKPRDKAAFWVEYILRHNGAPHLKSTALNLKWYQYLLLDVVFTVVLSVLLFVVLLFKLIRCVVGQKRSKNNQIKKNK